jgi:molybdenum cofactor cytidylyltransferase
MSFPKIFVIPNPGIVPIVLAAGASSRMGRPKELLELADGVACIDVVLDACARAGLGPAIVVAREERGAVVGARVAARAPRPLLVVNPRPDLGQTSSLQAGLAWLPPDAVGFLIYPVDFPLVTADDVRRLCEAFATGGARVVAPSFGNRRGHPVAVAAALAPALLALPAGGSARAVMNAEADATFYLTFNDDRVLTDMDTPDAYEACKARYRARG